MKDLTILQQYRVKHPIAGWGDDKNGWFIIPIDGYDYKIIASNGGDWEHVSVSGEKHPPSWPVMSRIKIIFFNDDEVVMQLHPAEKDYINNHPNCLHLWRPMYAEIPLPPKEFV